MKLFCVKMQTNGAQPTECGATMISRTSGSLLPEGKFIETVKNWQEEWFYMADVPLGNREGIPTPFTTTSSDRLHSWMLKNNALGGCRGGAQAFGEGAVLHRQKRSL